MGKNIVRDISIIVFNVSSVESTSEIENKQIDGRLYKFLLLYFGIALGVKEVFWSLKTEEKKFENKLTY